MHTSTLVSLCAAMIAAPVSATIAPAVVAGGGGAVRSTGITIRGTIGQSSAGAVSGNGVVQVKSGYWSAPPMSCEQDINSDLIINTADLGQFLHLFGAMVAPGAPGDFNNDGVVNTVDLGLFLQYFGSTHCGGVNAPG